MEKVTIKKTDYIVIHVPNEGAICVTRQGILDANKVRFHDHFLVYPINSRGYEDFFVENKTAFSCMETEERDKFISDFLNIFLQETY